MKAATTLSFRSLIHRALSPLRFAESYPALLLAGALMMLGMSGVWVNMPLSGSSRLTELTPATRDILLLSAGLMGLFLLATAMKRPLLRLVISLILFGLFSPLPSKLAFSTALIYCNISTKVRSSGKCSMY